MKAKKKPRIKKTPKRKPRVIKTFPTKKELEQVTEKTLLQYQAAIKNLAKR